MQEALPILTLGINSRGAEGRGRFRLAVIGAPGQVAIKTVLMLAPNDSQVRGTIVITGPRAGTPGSNLPLNSDAVLWA